MLLVFKVLKKHSNHKASETLALALNQGRQHTDFYVATVAKIYGSSL